MIICEISESMLVLFIAVGVYLACALWVEATEAFQRWRNRRRRHE